MIQTFYFNPFRVCTYVVNDTQGNAVIIDAGCQTAREKERLATYITQNNLHVRAHLLTHGHLDHLMGARFVYEQYGVLPHLSQADDWYFTRQSQQSAAFGCPIEDEPLQEYIDLSASLPSLHKDKGRKPHEETTMYACLQFGDMQFYVIPTPGHTQGGVCYLLEGRNKKQEVRNKKQEIRTKSILFSGDTLFAGGIGRTDLPGGDYDTLMRSIYERLLTLPDTTHVYPGHGFETTIGEERSRFE